LVTLADGGEVDIWADAITGLTDKTVHMEEVVFGVLMDVATEDQDALEVMARTVPLGTRVVVAVARFPRGSVGNVRSV
jgi:hypothetical protein